MSRKEGSTEGESSSNWANIVGDVLRCIADKTHSVQDRTRMGTVCRSWQASLKDKEIIFPICLMLAEKEDSDKRCFYNISEEIFIELELPEIRGRRCWGSPFGWLITCGLDLEIQLFNPLSRANLALPPLNTFTHRENWQNRTSEHVRNYFIKKLLLSSNPASPDCFVFAIYSEYNFLAIAKPGDNKAWTPINAAPTPIEATHIIRFDDVICFNGSFFAVRDSGQLFLCQDIDASHPNAVEFASVPPTWSPRDAGWTKYLVDMGGNLCVLSRIIQPYGYTSDIGEGFTSDSEEEIEIFTSDNEGGDNFFTKEFHIFKLNMQTKNWERILSLGDRSLFLGNCYTFSVIAADYHGCMSNCIYVTNDYLYCGGSDIGIYNCEKKETLDLFPKLDNWQYLRSSFSPPLWFIHCPH
ncbi:hypothetical protein QUC31_005501 [Theobroma cacao]